MIDRIARARAERAGGPAPAGTLPRPLPTAGIQAGIPLAVIGGQGVPAGLR